MKSPCSVWNVFSDVKEEVELGLEDKACFSAWYNKNCHEVYFYSVFISIQDVSFVK